MSDMPLNGRKPDCLKDTHLTTGEGMSAPQSSTLQGDSNQKFKKGDSNPRWIHMDSSMVGLQPNQTPPPIGS